MVRRQRCKNVWWYFVKVAWNILEGELAPALRGTVVAVSMDSLTRSWFNMENSSYFRTT